MNTRFPSDGSSDLHQLAGEYVLGTLPAEQRRAVQESLPRDAALRAAVQDWEERLLPLAALSEPVPPSPKLWNRITRSVDAQAALTAAPAKTHPTLPKHVPWWQDWHSLALWRGLTAIGFAAAAILAFVLVHLDVQPAAPRFMVVLVAPQDKAPGWVIEASAARQINLIPLATAQVPEGKALQFWTKADGWNGPVSLGLVKPGQTLTVMLDKLPPLQPDQLFELTLEPAAGSTIGKPTGPIQFIGRAVRVM